MQKRFIAALAALIMFGTLVPHASAQQSGWKAFGHGWGRSAPAFSYGPYVGIISNTERNPEQVRFTVNPSRGEATVVDWHLICENQRNGNTGERKGSKVVRSRNVHTFHSMPLHNRDFCWLWVSAESRQWQRVDVRFEARY